MATRGERRSLPKSNMKTNSFLTLMFLMLGCGADAQNAPQPVAGSADRNLFANGNFENGTDGWAFTSYGKKGSMELDPQESHAGKPSLRIVNTEIDHTLANQKIAVKPNTRYRISGFIKTKNVEPQKKGQKEGAELMVTGGWTRTPPVSGTKPWGKVTLEFATGKESEIVVGMSLGHYSAGVSGTAWFSDLSVIELGRNTRK